MIIKTLLHLTTCFTRIAVTGNLTAEEFKQLTDSKDVKFTQSDSDLTVQDEELSIKVDKKDLSDVINMIEGREKQNLSSFKNILKTLKKNENNQKTLLQRIEEGTTSFFLIFSNEITGKDTAHLRMLKEKEIPYFITSDKKIAESLDCKFPSVLGYNANDSIIYKTENLNVGMVLTPILSTLTTDSIKYMDLSGIPPFYIFFDSDLTNDNIATSKDSVDKKRTTSISRAELRGIAYENKEKYKFSLIKYVKGQTDLSHFGISEGDLPAMVHVNEKREKFVLKELTDVSVRNYIETFSQAIPYKRSEKSDTYDEKNKEGGLKYLVGENHNSFLQSNIKKDTLVVYGSARCPHCVKLLPTLAKLAEDLKDVKNVEISYIDLEKNDVSVKIEAFPTIMLYPASEDKKSEKTLDERGIKYADFSRTDQALRKFIKEKGTLNKELEVIEEQVQEEPFNGDENEMVPPQDVEHVKEEAREEL
ncbi:Protein disulfide isomerase (prolyl 4-hydroxylase beta subunit) [Pseudoloma neurophilia]|uniref:Protein disulfide isomerase (Prolyl 4-hydroxylase beta subunit) n=1 Tax=Pseudoloma neurophilia TaxID=146866 RepID=A0A0R0LUT7_9MICR|nr:Protein disulfide isomerase (prolyl 4-hydroxylase beta subunit) [Pseudoloma neurophilia]